MRRRRPGTDASLLLPDSWSGPYSRPENAPVRSRGRTMQPGGGGCDARDWLRVTIVGRDPLAVTGMRHLLASHASVWLNICTYVPDKASLAGQDIVIWLRVHHDGMPDLAGHVASLCRLQPAIKQLVVSDFLPALTPPGPGPLSGVWMARGGENRDMLSALLRCIIHTPRVCGPLLTRRLSRTQWRILLLRAAGACTRSIAVICGISIKTVSVHESAIRERLGLYGRIEYAWLLRSVALMQDAVPALRRDVRRLSAKGLESRVTEVAR